MPARGGAIPLLAETHQGRPTKLEGNPGYAPHGTATSLIAQAAVLDLYDPDRSTTALHGSEAIAPAQMNDLLARIRQDYTGSKGAGLALLAGESTSPTRAALVAMLRQKFPKAIWAEYEPVDPRAPQTGATAVCGRAVQPLYRFAAAKRVLSLDCDFLQAEPGAIAHARDWARGRRVSGPGDDMSRLYIAESHFTITGSNADHRLRVASSHIPALAAAVAMRVFAQKGRFGELSGVLAKLATGLEVETRWLDACVADLMEHGAASLVCAGFHHSPAMHALALAMNEVLGGVGTTVELVEVDAPAAASIQDLAAAIAAGQVSTLVILGGNPVYNAPADLDWPAVQASVGEVVRHGLYVDETSVAVLNRNGYHLHDAHFLETWGDARTADGTIVPVQPMILPLFDGLSEIELLARIMGDAVNEGYGLVRRTLLAKMKEGDKGLRQWLSDGVLPGSAHPAVDARVRAAELRGLLEKVATATGRLSATNLEVRFIADLKVDDGRHANNGWLQECPEPITKISWDNPIQISPRLAADLGLVDPKRLDPNQPATGALDPARHDFNAFEIGKQEAHLVRLTVNGRSVEGPVHIQPGLANYTVVVPLGYGRTAAGRIGNGTGFSAYPVVASGSPAFATGAKLELLPGATHQLPNTQEHWAFEGRDIIREANLTEHVGNPHWVAGIGMESHTPAIYGPDQDQPLQYKATAIPRGNSLYETPKFDGLHQWGLSIDLNTCIGCNACVIACQAENNIPIVGRDQVLRGREMHWIRLDRYYSSGSANNAFIPEDPQVSLQPMTCQHCELAPCESVCPVNATVHDEEGLNVMAYNRCIGTRYCANNCPYKVRRFNFFDYQQRQLDSLYLGPLGPQGMPELLKMHQNPDVTVRMRGVMEKCTYCVQRIERAKIAQRVKAGASGNILVPDGVIKTACEQVCPTEAIVFGNLKDERSAVSRVKLDPRTYAVLGYLNIRPRTSYLGRLRNPNPAMPGYQDLPLSRLEYQHKNHPAGHGGAHGAAQAGGEAPGAKGGHE